MNNKQNNTNNKFGRVLAVPSLCELYPDICLTTEEKARKNLSQGPITRTNDRVTWVIVRNAVRFFYHLTNS
jgi:hypothetical protein